MTSTRSALALTTLLLAACSPEPQAPEAVRPVRSITLADTAEFASRTFPGRASATREAIRSGDSPKFSGPKATSS